MPVFTLPSLSSTSIASSGSGCLGRVEGTLKVLNRGSKSKLAKSFTPVLATMGATTKGFNPGEGDGGVYKELGVANQHTLGVMGVVHPTKFPPSVVISDQQSNTSSACVPMTIAVAEFKGPDVHGVVRFAQGSTGVQASCSIEAVIDGLAPGAHGWSVHEFGDLTQGPMSTGPVYNIDLPSSTSEKRGNLGMLLVDSHGHVESTATHDMLIVADVIGRSVVLYGVSEQGQIARVAAAVIARSARPSSLNPQLCNCDGSLLWQGTTTS